MSLIKKVYYTIRQIMLNGHVPLCARNILDIDEEARGFWALMPLSGVYYPIFCYVDYAGDGCLFIRFCIGINYGTNPNLNGLMRDYLIALSPSFDKDYYYIADTLDSCVYITADAAIGDSCPTEENLEKAIHNLLAISSYLTDDDLLSVVERAWLISEHRFCRVAIGEDVISRFSINTISILKDDIPQRREPSSE